MKLEYNEDRDEVSIKMNRVESYHLWCVLAHVGGSGPIRDTIQKIHDFVDDKIVDQRGAVAFTGHFTQKKYSALFLDSNLNRDELSNPDWWDNWAKSAYECYHNIKH